MCIFTGDIDFVSATRIFARMESGRQAIVYDMYLSTASETAMVLPIPVAAGKTDRAAEFVDLSEYENLFDDLDGLFPKMRGLTAAPASNMDTLSLAVEEVGVFEASYVPKPEDFSRLDPRFSLNTDFFEKIPEYRHYGFVVFQLKPGESQVHPMAFWFPSKDTAKLFYPTVHMHHGELHEQDEFNHVLYAQGRVATLPDMRYTHNAKGGNKIEKIAQRSKGLISSSEEVSKLAVYGERENKDIWFSLQ